MRLGILGYNKPEKIYISVKNNETSTVVFGQPLCFVMSGTDDGILVELPNTVSAGKAQGTLAGVCAKLGGIAAGEYGLVQVYGYNTATKIVRQARTASTVTFETAAAIAVGEPFQVTTIGNGMTRQGAVATAIHAHYCVAGEAVASLDSIATTSSETRLQVTSMIKTFLRLM